MRPNAVNTQAQMPDKSPRYENMDLVRYVLAFAVVMAHFNFIFNGNFWWPMSSATAVGAFFGLSGFLVYASYQRHPHFTTYIKSRMRRIMPSYYFIVLGCAIGLSLVSSLTIAEYFCHPDFWKYLISNACFLNFLQPDLPGVFTDHAMTCINGSLWTLKVEWMLYLSIPVFFYLARRYKWNIICFITIIFILSVAYREAMTAAYASTGKTVYHILSYQFAGQMVYFFAGVLFYHILGWVKRNKALLLAIGTALCLVNYGISLLAPSILTQCASDLLFPIGIVAICIALSLTKSLGNWISKLGNCSYEIYLFHFPVLQLARELGLSDHLSVGASLAVCVTVIFTLSFLFNKYIRTSVYGKRTSTQQSQ